MREINVFSQTFLFILCTQIGSEKWSFIFLCLLTIAVMDMIISEQDMNELLMKSKWRRDKPKEHRPWMIEK